MIFFQKEIISCVCFFNSIFLQDVLDFSCFATWTFTIWFFIGFHFVWAFFSNLSGTSCWTYNFFNCELAVFLQCQYWGEQGEDNDRRKLRVVIVEALQGWATTVVDGKAARHDMRRRGMGTGGRRTDMTLEMRLLDWPPCPIWTDQLQNLDVNVTKYQNLTIFYFSNWSLFLIRTDQYFPNHFLFLYAHQAIMYYTFFEEVAIISSYT